MIAGFFAPLVLDGVVLALHVGLPARNVSGYVRDEAGNPLPYRLNGLLVLGAVLAGWAAACASGALPWDFLYVERWSSLAGACTLGLVFTLVIVLGAKRRGAPRALLAELYLGRLDNPQWRIAGAVVDAKMVLYLVGAVGLELNILSFAAHHVLSHRAHPSPGALLYTALLSFFVCEYLFFERVHLYTYDFFAEKVGFKLGWGCLAFYPYFYSVGLWATAVRPDPGTPAALLALAAAVFFSGWALSRGANLQKYAFKTDPAKKAFGVLAPATVTDGQRSLLCSGFWGMSRHVNYLGEILMAVGLTLALGYAPWSSPWPWLYPLYYVGLLFPRQADDDRRCAQKYGALWDAYKKRVPYRIVPWVY